MATNPPNGEVRQRSQVLNPKTDQWLKRDTKSGQFMDVKQGDLLERICAGLLRSAEELREAGALAAPENMTAGAKSKGNGKT